MIFKMEESAEDWGGGVRENRICFIGRNLNKELSKYSSFVNLAMELFNYTESYTSTSLDAITENQTLLGSNLILDFTKDLNIREVQFVEVFENYKKIVKQLSKYNCLECPKFTEHVKKYFF